MVLRLGTVTCRSICPMQIGLFAYPFSMASVYDLVLTTDQDLPLRNAEDVYNMG
jgi:hypothetical protein